MGSGIIKAELGAEDWRRGGCEARKVNRCDQAQ